MLKPAALKQGDTIGIVATSWLIKPETLEAGKAFLESRGFKVQTHPNNYMCHDELWGGDYKTRATALHEYWADPSIKAIIATTGGLRCLNLLDYLDFNLLKQTPKIFSGFSDNTAIINALWHKLQIPSLHGPHVRSLVNDNKENNLADFLSVTSGAKSQFEFEKIKCFKAGEAAGHLIGGNLCLMNYLLGTEYAPTFKNAIILIEDEMEEIRNIDRMLLQLRRLGKLEEAAGLIIGNFTMIKNSGTSGFPYSLDELIKEYTHDLNIPVVMTHSFGHDGRMMSLPIGVQAALNVSETGASLSLLESYTG